MLVRFRRTGRRSYAIEVERDGAPDLEMNPAPGYDAFLPHDLLHLVAEAVLGLEQGIFGQLAAGGDAGTFRIKAGAYQSSREAARARRRLQKRGAQLARAGADASAQSERASYLCWQAWRSRSAFAPERKQAETMASQARSIRALMPPEEAERLDADLDNICAHLDVLGAQWRRLQVGGALQVRWPDLAVVTESVEVEP